MSSIGNVFYAVSPQVTVADAPTSTTAAPIASTPNTGSFTVQMPNTITTPIKLRVSSIGNVFYAVSPQVTVADAPTSTTAAP
ncbi:hypothetical protein, partial [Chryseobacterium sp. CH1]|uniref:hypothetical protein n=1 Tax=Chryseobacterium sp. CH1 TaxID=713551 RepID=UPI0013E97FD5